MHPFSLRFDDPQDEGAFCAEYDGRTARTSRVALLAGAPGYAGMVAILDDNEARAVALLMVAVLVAWIGVAFHPSYAQRCQLANAVAVALVSALSLVLVLALPAPSAVIVMIAFTTLNFMWVFVFLRPRIVYAVPFGAVYVAALTVVGAIVWDRYGAGHAPRGMVAVAGGVGGGIVVVFAYSGFLFALSAFIAYRFERGERTDHLLRRELAAAHATSERLLTNVLPVVTAERLKAGEHPIADACPAVSVVFADIVGFTTMVSTMRPESVLALLDEVFTRFDELAVEHGLEKIKTIGDAYMAVAGAPEPMARHAHAAMAMGLDMIAATSEVIAPDGRPLSLRVGVGSGSAVAGVIGRRKFSYDLWGDTVNTASRMESYGIGGHVHVDDATRALVGDHFRFVDRGTIDVKGKGPMHTWLVDAKSQRRARC